MATSSAVERRRGAAASGGERHPRVSPGGRVAADGGRTGDLR
ncbi:hypothetical protein [Streptomyces sp. SAS_272]